MMFWRQKVHSTIVTETGPSVVSGLGRVSSCVWPLTWNDLPEVVISRIIDHISSSPQDTCSRSLFLTTCWTSTDYLRWTATSRPLVPLLRPPKNCLIDWLFIDDLCDVYSDVRRGIRTRRLQQHPGRWLVTHEGPDEPVRRPFHCVTEPRAGWRRSVLRQGIHIVQSQHLSDQDCAQNGNLWATTDVQVSRTQPRARPPGHTQRAARTAPSHTGSSPHNDMLLFVLPVALPIGGQHWVWHTVRQSVRSVPPIFSK